jgi:diglucosylglycerate octanoyltransferase
MPIEDKWKANMEKVAFMKQFPGLLDSWASLTGKTVETVIGLKSKAGSAVVVFTDGSFTVVPPLSTEPYELGEALTAARQYLESKHREAYAEHDRLVKKDKDAQKSARLSNILGAIQNNVDQIPELKDKLKALVKEWK